MAFRVVSCIRTAQSRFFRKEPSDSIRLLYVNKSNFSRWAGVLIAAVVIVAATLLTFAVATMMHPDAGTTSEGTFFGLWSILYVTQAPDRSVMYTAIALALLLAAGIAIIERRIATRYRRSGNERATPLAPKLIMSKTRGVFAGPITITVLLPAHNEEASLPGTLDSLFSQSHPPERVIVVADNCTDGTERIAAERGVEVMPNVGNSDKKAGALNQVLSRILPFQGDNDLVMIMDADTQLDDGFLEAAASRFANDRALMAVGGLFHGEPGHGLIGQFQRNEYIRYSRELKRRRGRVFVLTGTASLFRPVALREVAANRGKDATGHPRRRLRHSGPDRGQRADNCVEIARCLDHLPFGMHSGHGADADLAHAVEPTPALAAGCVGKPRGLWPDAADPALLGAAAGHRLRRHRTVLLPGPAACHGAGFGQLDLVPVLAGARGGVYH